MNGSWLCRGNANLAVVFVHGILADSVSAWTHKNGTYWPELLRRSYLGDSSYEREDSLTPNIYVYSYKTDFFSGNYRLGDVVDDLKERLLLDGVLDSQGVIFVCHSMGGLIARRYVVQREADLAARNLQLGFFMVASPSLGSGYANLLGPIAKLLRHSQADALRFSQNNAWLNDLDKDFKNLVAANRLPISGKELIEDQFYVFSSIFRKQIVEPFSGDRYFGEGYKVPNSDHASIAKPENSMAMQNRLLRRFINNFPVDYGGFGARNRFRYISEATLLKLESEIRSSTNTVSSKVRRDDLPPVRSRTLEKLLRAAEGPADLLSSHYGMDAKPHYDSLFYVLNSIAADNRILELGRQSTDSGKPPDTGLYTYSGSFRVAGREASIDRQDSILILESPCEDFTLRLACSSRNFLRFSTADHFFFTGEGEEPLEGIVQVKHSHDGLILGSPLCLV